MLALPLTRGLVTYIDDVDGDLASCKWSSDAKGYAHRHINNTTVRMHRIIMGRVIGRSLADSERVDHINCNKADNRRDNLRLASDTQNQVNTPDSGVMPVQKSPQSRIRWRARVRSNGKLLHIGYFASEHEARAAYAQKRGELYGEYAYQPRPVLDEADAPLIVPTKHWSRKHACCVYCGTTERPHQGRGYCTRCRHYR